MSKKVLILTVIALLFAASDLQAAQINSSWDGGGVSNLWSDANNWDPNIVPDNGGGNTFAVIIDSNWAKVGLKANHTIDKLDCYGSVDFTRYTESRVELTLVDPNGLTNHGHLEIDSCYDEAGSYEVIRIIGNVTNVNDTSIKARLELWTMEIDGDLYNSAGAGIYSGDVRIMDNLENAGLLTTDGDFDVDDNLNNTGEIKLYGADLGANDILDNNTCGDISGYGKVGAEGLFRNKGSIYATGGLLVIEHEGPFLNSGLIGNAALATLNVVHEVHVTPPTDVNNNGTIEVNAGGGVAFDCNLVNDTNGIIKLLGGTLAATTITQSADANFAGFGTIAADLFLNPNSLIELTGPTNIVGDVNIPAGATLKISDGQTLITGHTICDGSIDLIGGTVIFQGGCDCSDCNITHNPGTDRNHFDINADGIENFKDFSAFAKSWLWQASWY